MPLFTNQNKMEFQEFISKKETLQSVIEDLKLKTLMSPIFTPSGWNIFK